MLSCRIWVSGIDHYKPNATLANLFNRVFFFFSFHAGSLKNQSLVTTNLTVIMLMLQRHLKIIIGSNLNQVVTSLQLFILLVLSDF